MLQYPYMQTVVSIAIIILAILSSLVVVNLIKLTRELQRISKDFHTSSQNVVQQIQDILDALSGLPFLSFIFRKSRSSSTEKVGRTPKIK